MPERSPSPEPELSDFDEVFLHDIEEMENTPPEINMNALSGTENIDPDTDIDIDDTENIAPEIDTPENIETDPRFVTLPDDAVQDFILRQENRNTAKKTFYDMKLVKTFLQKKGETREAHDIPPNELDNYLSNFVLSVRKRDGGEFEPSSVRAMISSVDRRLKAKKYGVSIMNSKEDAFQLTRKTLKAKQKHLKKMGKGNRPNRASMLTDNQVDILYEKGLLGVGTAEALLNTVWLNNSVRFGLRGGKVHHELLWGDVQLKTDCDGCKYLELQERQTKTRSGEDVDDIRPVTPKMFSNGTERDPVAAYEKYASSVLSHFLRQKTRFTLPQEQSIHPFKRRRYVVYLPEGWSKKAVKLNESHVTKCWHY